MGDRSGIAWTEATWNPIVGCTYCSPGCLNCYAASNAAGRLAHLPLYAGLAVRQPGKPAEFTGEVRLAADRLDQPLRWKRPRRIFVNSMSDLFHPDVPAEWLTQIWDVMVRAGQHTYQVLTKRPQLIANRLGPAGTGFYTVEGQVPCPQPNVWLGASIESDRYTFRADHLRAAPAAVRFLSLEPLLGPVPSLDLSGIDWVIVGGESGPRARPMDPEWARDVLDLCAQGSGPCPTCSGDKSIEVDSTPGNRGFAACPSCFDERLGGPTGRKRVACFFKQAGAVLAREWGMGSASGHDIDSAPAEFRVQEYPA